MKYAIYNTTTGVIRQRCIGHPSEIELDLRDGEEFYLNAPDNATHIINNEPVTIGPPPPSFEELKAGKYREITDAFNSQVSRGTADGFMSSNGWMVYDATEDLSNYERALNSLRLTGIGSKTIKVKSDPVFVTATIAELEEIVRDLTLHGEDLYTRKWALQAQVNAATTPEELESIRW